MSTEVVELAGDGRVTPVHPAVAAVLVEQYLERPRRAGIQRPARPHPMHGQREGLSVPPCEGVLRRRVAQVPGSEQAMESELVAPQHGDVDIAVRAHFGVEEEVKRPAACDPPRCVEIRE
jgi:hypothetical protein